MIPIFYIKEQGQRAAAPFPCTPNPRRPSLRFAADYLAVRSKLKCPVFVASEMSGFKVVPSPYGWG